METAPLVSIIIPAFNAEEYLGESILSIIQQSYQDWELIIINDGSVDNTAAIIEDFAQKDNRIIALENETNKGLVFTRNKGLKKAKGELIANLDSDDIAFPNRIAIQVEFFKKHPNYVLIGSGCELIDDKGNKIGEEKRVVENEKLESLLVFSNYFINSSVMFRSSTLNEVSYDENIHLAEDYNFFVKLSTYGKIGNINQPLIRYRVHGNNISSKHKSDLSKNVWDIQVHQLSKLGVTPSEREMVLHSGLVDQEETITKEKLLEIEGWLIKLINANNNSKIYKQDAFNFWCSFFYQRSCLKLKSGLKSFTSYQKSELSKHGNMALSNNLTFFAKSILKKI